ncbi:MAG: AsmA family protein [bacterium]|nr:AsmA family protein [bacterium]
MKKLAKILTWTAGVVLVLLIVAVIGLKLFFPTEKVRQMAEERGSEMMGRELAVETLDVSFWGGLGVLLENVRIGNPPGDEGPDFLAAETIDLKLRMWPLVFGDIRVDRLIVERPIINMRKSAAGAVNFEFDLPDTTIAPELEEQLTPETKSAAAAVSFDDLEIHRGSLKYHDDSTGMIVEALGLDLATSLKNPHEALYESSGKIKIDSLKVTIDEPYPVFAVGLQYAVGFDMNNQHVSIDRADLTVNDLRFKLSGEAFRPMGDMAARCNVKSDRLTVADLFNLLPAGQREMVKDYTVEGDFAFDADLDYDAARVGSELTYTGTASLSDMVMSSREIEGELKFARCLIDFKPDNLRMNIEDGSFDGQPLKGHLMVDDFENPTIGGELAGSFNLVFLEPFLPPEAGHKVSGRTSFDVKFSGPVSEPENMSFSGTVAVSDGRYESSSVPEPVEGFTLDAFFDNRLLNIRSLACRFPSGDLHYAGRVNDLVPYLLADSAEAEEISPSVEGNLKGQVDFGLLKPYLPEKGNPELAGQLAVDVSFAGNIDDPSGFRPRGTLAVTDASYSDSLLSEPIENFRAELELKPDTIAVTGLEVEFTSSDVSFTGQLIKPFPYLLPVKDLDRSKMKKPLFLFTLESRRFDTDKLFPEAVPGSSADPTEVSMDSVSMIMLPDIDGRGTLAADTVIYSGVELTGVKGKVRIQDRKIECYDATAQVYSGGVSGKTTIDLGDFENPVYTGEFAATQIEADDFISRFTSFGGHLFGKTNFNGSYSAKGWDPEAFLNSLTLDGLGEVRQGKLVTSGAVHGLLNQLGEMAKTPVGKEQTLRDLVSRISIEDGKVKLDKFETSLDKLGDITLDGSYGFSGVLDYSGSIELSQELSDKLTSSSGLMGGVASLFGNPKTSRLTVPFKIGGTVDKPDPKLDLSGVVGENLQNQVGNALQGLLKKKE